MIANETEYQKAQEELAHLQQWLERLKNDQACAEKGFTKAGVHKMIARIHEEPALYEGSQEVRK